MSEVKNILLVGVGGQGTILASKILTSGLIKAGYDVRHAAIGPGTLNSHGYERTHIDGLRNTYLLLMEYLKK